ncbi:hypothetical protein NH340_JMT07490 [Sarcoptes scabiei]|nr:hypothetical protein NH340_JMT07490 [Sarcoptes scabiei]
MSASAKKSNKEQSSSDSSSEAGHSTSSTLAVSQSCRQCWFSSIYATWRYSRLL